MAENINFSTITNKEYKELEDFKITYGIAETKFGHCLIGLNDKCICYLSLFDTTKDNLAVYHLQLDWPNATLRADDAKIEQLASSIFEPTQITKVDILLRGTELQCNVWKELTKLKEGMTTNYMDVAKSVGHPKATRAVASAIAKNKIAYLIPCHRVIRKTGALSKYRWGPERKMQLLEMEAEE